MKTSQAKAIKAAASAIASFDLSDVETVVTDCMESEDYEKLYRAVDPEFDSRSERRDELFKLIDQDLSTDKGRALHLEADDLVNAWVSCIEKAHFYLGFAAAQKLLAAQERRRPAV